jgi:hypothetical protein
MSNECRINVERMFCERSDCVPNLFSASYSPAGQVVEIVRPESSTGHPITKEDHMKTTTKMRKITVRRTGDIRLTSAPCDNNNYHIPVGPVLS